MRLFDSNDEVAHKDYIKVFLNFLEFLITNSRNGQLSFSNIQALFKTMVSQSITDYEQRLFFNFLTKENESS